MMKNGQHTGRIAFLRRIQPSCGGRKASFSINILRFRKILRKNGLLEAIYVGRRMPSFLIRKRRVLG